MTDNNRSRIKNEEQYESLREQGASKEKAARIANTPNKKAGQKGGRHSEYESWKKEDLQKKASQVGIEGRSKMSKSELIDSLRHH